MIAAKEKRGWWHPIAIFLALAALAAVATAVYVALNRLSTDALTIIFAFGCAGAFAAPGTLLTVIMLIRRAENGKAKAAVAPQMTQPVIAMVPPMALPQQQLPQPPPTWERVPARKFTVVGEKEEDW